MKVPVLEDLIEDVETDLLGKALNRYSMLSSIREHFLESPDRYCIRANDLLDYINWLCGFSPRDLSATKFFYEICRIYYQLGHTAEDVPAKDGKDPFTAFLLYGIIEAIGYLMRGIEDDRARQVV